VLRHAGRAAAEVGKSLHRFSHFMLSLVILLSLASAGAAWRLSRGPVSLEFIKDRIERAVNAGLAPAHVTLGGVSIAWGGFSHGLDQPLVLRVTDLSVEAAAGTAGVSIPFAEATLSARWLLLGRIVPRSITLQGAHIVLTRGTDGSVNFDIGGTARTDGPSPLTGLVGILGTPAGTDRQTSAHQLSQLSAVSIHGATLLLDDRMLGMTWSADPADIDFVRHPGGGMDGRATLALALSGQKAVLTGSFTIAPKAHAVRVMVRLSRVTPMALANSAPILAPLAAIDVPLTLDGEADFGPDLSPVHLRVTAHAGTGKVMTDRGSIPIRQADVTVAGTPEQATLESAVVELQSASGSAISTFKASGPVFHKAGRLGAALHLTLDHADFADLAALWPADIAPNPRTWITENIQSGTAHDGTADVVIDMPDNAPDITLSKATATLEGDDLSVTWLSRVPPIEHGKAHLVLTDPDKLEIDVRAAQQIVNGADPIAVPYGHVTVVGLTKKDQIATVQCETSGTVVSAIALLKEPRLRILDRHPMDLKSPSGFARISIHAVVPLLRDLQIDDVEIHSTGSLSNVHLTGIVAGRDLDDGTLLLDADTNHLSIKGAAKLAGIQTNLDALMDFRAGSPSQVLQRYQVTGRANARALADAGLDTGDTLSNGDIGLNLVLNEHRNGDGDLTVDADLAQVGVDLSAVGWRKPVGSAAKATARVVLLNDRLMGIGKLTADGVGVQLDGSVTAVDGKLDTIKLDRLVLGRSDVRGTIHLPRNGPIELDLNGPALDASAKLMQKSPKRDPTTPRPPPGLSWSMHGRFEHVFMAHDVIANQVVTTGESDGEILSRFTLSGRTGPGNPFSIRIGLGTGEMGRTARLLAIDVEDAGSVLRGLDVTQEIQSGMLRVSGAFDDTTPDHALAGTLDLSDFRVIHAPALGKLLQALTLYGLVEALSGPGLGFSRLIAPFKLDGDALELTDARAFSASLGLTAHGRIDRANDRVDLDGTVVPAYLFNTILGHIPLIGQLFTAEKGGGLFAMNYSLHGPIDNPNVAANPLSVLTPGILRGMFGSFDAPPPPTPRRPPLDRPVTGDNAGRQ